MIFNAGQTSSRFTALNKAIFAQQVDETVPIANINGK